MPKLMSRTATVAAAAALVIGLGAVSLTVAPVGSAFAQQGQRGDSPGGPGKGRDGPKGPGADHGKQGTSEDRIMRGKKGSVTTQEEEDSDKRGPAYKGGRDTGKPGTAGTKKGTTYADLWVILRNPDGTPILTPEGFVQPLDKDGNVIPLNADGTPVNPDAVVEVELSRLSVGRSPTKVLDRQLADVVSLINSATAISLDTAGRIVVTVGTETKTIDSPLANLALYKTLLTVGYIPGISPTINLGTLSYLNDGTKTTADYLAAASFLGAASDKTTKLVVDSVVYMNQILQIPGTTYTDGKVYVAYPTTLTYDRTVYSNVMVTVLVKQPDGSYVKTDVRLLDAVFGGTTFTTPLTGLAAATQAADDARAVIQFLHDNPLPSN